MRCSTSNDLANSLSTALVESNPTNLASGNLANPSAIEEPSQYDHWLVESRNSGGNNYKSENLAGALKLKALILSVNTAREKLDVHWA